MDNKKQDPYKQQRRDWGTVKPATREHNDKYKYDRKDKHKKDLRDLDENRHHHVRKRRIYTEEAEGKIPFTEFLDHCVAMGGNWTGMLLYGIRDMFPDYYEKMPDKNYSYKEVCDILVNDLNIDPNS